MTLTVTLKFQATGSIVDTSRDSRCLRPHPHSTPTSSSASRSSRRSPVRRPTQLLDSWSAIRAAPAARPPRCTRPPPSRAHERRVHPPALDRVDSVATEERKSKRFVRAEESSVARLCSRSRVCSRSPPLSNVRHHTSVGQAAGCLPATWVRPRSVPSAPPAGRRSCMTTRERFNTQAKRRHSGAARTIQPLRQ